jgi:hypothetical protein
MSHIVTGEEFYSAPEGARPDPEWLVRMFGPKDVPFTPGDPSPSDPPVEARIDWGRWVVDCLMPNCGGAQAAFQTDKRFLCTYCLNTMFGGRWLRVVWPKRSKKETIEEILNARPWEGNQNWRPNETMHDLRAENIEHLGLV